jgi:hypothetical protein
MEAFKNLDRLGMRSVPHRRIPVDENAERFLWRLLRRAVRELVSSTRIASPLRPVVHPHLRRAAKRVTVRAATAHEIHYACDMHNWDDGTKLLEWAVRQPQCDPATALMIYFRAQPAYIFSLRRPDADERRTTRWLESIEQRFARGAFQPASVAYNPIADVGRANVVSKYVPRSMNMVARPVRGSRKYPYPRLTGRAVLPTTLRRSLEQPFRAGFSENKKAPHCCETFSFPWWSRGGSNPRPLECHC